jgi:hypothetical protein
LYFLLPSHNGRIDGWFDAGMPAKPAFLHPAGARSASRFVNHFRSLAPAQKFLTKPGTTVKAEDGIATEAFACAKRSPTAAWHPSPCKIDRLQAALYPNSTAGRFLLGK